MITLSCPDNHVIIGRNRPDWLITNHVISITSSDWLFTQDAIAQVVGSDQMIMVSDTTVSLVQISNGFVHHSYTLETNRGHVVSISPLSVSHPCTTSK